jgi:hypothetical protein
MRDDRRNLALNDSEAVLRQVLLELDDLGPTRDALAYSHARAIEVWSTDWRSDATGCDEGLR